MRRIPPLNSVRAFEAVARHQSFSAAANELCVTVAAVSHQVRQLEEGLGQKLLERGRQARLTPAGHILYPLLRDGFDQIAQALQRLVDLCTHLRQGLHFGLHPFAAQLQGLQR